MGGPWFIIGSCITCILARFILQGREGNYKVHSGSVDQLCWHPSKPDMLVTASGDKTIRIWDVRGMKMIGLFLFNSLPPKRVFISTSTSAHVKTLNVTTVHRVTCG